MTPSTTAERFEELVAAFTNAFEFEVWAIPTTVMLVGALFGIVVAILAMRRNERSIVDAEGRQLDLMRRRDTVVDAIRALDLERDKLAPEDYERERQLLLAHGAQALRDLEEDPVSLDDTDLIAAVEARRDTLGDGRVQAIKNLIAGGDPSPAPPPLPPPSSPAISPQWQGALITLGIFGVLGVLYLVLTGVEAANDRDAQAPAATSAPGAPATPTSAQIPRTEAEKTFATTLKSDPTNLEALNGLTDYEIRRQNWDEAKSLNERALAAAPGDPEARTWKALLVYRTGAYPEATRQLDSVIEEHPEFARGHQFRGMIHLQLKEFEPALAQFSKALELATDAPQRAGLKQLIADTQQAMNAGKPEIGGTIRLAPGVDASAWGPSAQVYVSVKGMTGPPMPLRAKRLANGPFPLEFSLASTDAPMRGGPLPAAVMLTVKVDLDGNPMGDDPGAPKLVVEGVTAGTLNLDLELGATP